MKPISFFAATVPVFLKALDQIDLLLGKAGTDALLATRLCENSFTAGENFRIAQGYILRIVCPLIDRKIPVLSTEDTDISALRRRSAEVRIYLNTLREADFSRTNDTQIHHVAGQADLTQTSQKFLTLYGLPNFYFHMTMGYAALRHAGANIGKGDYDGLHFYPDGFSFISGT
jgi:hypothetical protein